MTVSRGKWAKIVASEYRTGNARPGVFDIHGCLGQNCPFLLSQACYAADQLPVSKQVLGGKQTITGRRPQRIEDELPVVGHLESPVARDVSGNEQVGVDLCQERPQRYLPPYRVPTAGRAPNRRGNSFSSRVSPSRTAGSNAPSVGRTVDCG